MPNRVQTLRSSLTGNRPAASTRQPGELYVNFADNQFGVINTAQTAQDLIPIRFFSTTSNYNMNDYVVNAGVLYKATAAITAGAFNPAQWTSISASVTVGDIPPANPQSGNLWFDSLGGQLYVYYNDGNSAQWVIAVTNLVAPYVAGSSEGGFVNKFRNGTFDVWQRGNGPFTALGAAEVNTADGWKVISTGGTSTIQMGASRLLTSAALQLTGAAGVTDVQFFQNLESYIVAPLTSQICTFQAQIYNNTGVAFTPQLQLWVRSAQDSGTWTQVGSTVNLQSCPNGAWTRVAYTTIAAPANAYNGLQLVIDFLGALNGAGRSVRICEADLRATPNLPVGLCVNPPPPELRPVHEELAFCQRYFETSYDNQAPGTVGASNPFNVYITGLGNAANSCTWPVSYRTAKRIMPTVTLYSPTTGVSGHVRDVTNNVDVVSNLGGASRYDFGFFFTMAAACPNLNVNAHWTASAEL